VWESGWVNDTSKLQKTIGHCERVRKCWKRELNNISKWLKVVHTLLSETWKEDLGCFRTKWFALSKNTEDRAEWPLALAYVLYLYKLHWLHILDQELGA